MEALKASGLWHLLIILTIILVFTGLHKVISSGHDLDSRWYRSEGGEIPRVEALFTCLTRPTTDQRSKRRCSCPVPCAKWMPSVAQSAYLSLLWQPREARLLLAQKQSHPLSLTRLCLSKRNPTVNSHWSSVSGVGQKPTILGRPQKFPERLTSRTSHPQKASATLFLTQLPIGTQRQLLRLHRAKTAHAGTER